MHALFKRILPGKFRRTLECFEILTHGLGYTKSIRAQSCLDASGQPIPWYTYPAIEYLRQLDFSEKTVFEYGSGNSTLFWGRIAESVVSVESDSVWYEKIREYESSAAVRIHLVTEEESYVEFLSNCPDSFDVIVVDGLYRGRCAVAAVEKLRPGGLIILDNSDWFPKTAALLQAADLIEVDMSGFGPLNNYTWTTSLFLHREFNIPSRSPRQPTPAVGSIHQLASDDA